MPGALRDALETLVSLYGASGWRRTLFAACCALYMLGLGWALRAGALRVDLALADRARLRGGTPGPGVFAIGYLGVGAPRLGAVAGAALVLAEALRSPLFMTLSGPEGLLRGLLPLSRAVSRFFLS